MKSVVVGFTSSGRPPSAARLGPIAAIVATVGFLVLIGYSMIAARNATGGGGSQVNWQGAPAALQQRPAPPFTLRLIGGGGELRLADLRGQVVLVNFWASWCPPCRDEAPVLEAAHRAYQSRGLVVVGVDIWDKEADAGRFIQETGVTYPNGVDPVGDVAVEYGVRGIPESFIVDRDGRLVRRWIGPLTDTGVAQFVAELLD